MPTVNGPQSPNLPGPVDTSTPAPNSNSKPLNILPPATIGPPLDLTPPALRDGFSSPVGRADFSGVAGSAPDAGNPYGAEVRSAVDAFNQALDHVYLSNLGQPPGTPLTTLQQTQLKDAAKKFIEALPVGALAPQLAASVESALKAQGLPVDGLANKKLGELGSVGGDIAKSLAGQLKDQSPAAFYGLAAAGAAAVGYLGWAKGSAGLDALGIRPEIKKGFFDDHLDLKLKGTWGPHFSNPTLQPAVAAHVKLSNGLSLAGEVDFSPQNGLRNAGVDSASANVAWQPNDNFKLSASVAHNFNTRQTTGTVDADWKVRDNVDFALSGSYDSRGAAQVGAGLRIRF